jgi:hypothetical protein
MSLTGYNLAIGNFDLTFGPRKQQKSTGSSYTLPVIYNEDVPVGSAKRKYVNMSASVTIIDPNGEGTCVPRLVATSTLKMKVINSTSAVAADPFTTAAAEDEDITTLSDFLRDVILSGTIPAAA